MIIKRRDEVPPAKLEGYDTVTKQIVLGPDDGSGEIVMRYFSIGQGGSSPHHAHDFPHLVKIEAGTGIVIDESGNERQVQAGDYVYVKENDSHCFKNNGSDPFDFICIVPIRGEG